MNIESNTVDTSRYVPTRLVGYALASDQERLVLENAAPDYKKPISKANYVSLIKIIQYSGQLVTLLLLMIIIHAYLDTPKNQLEFSFWQRALHKNL